MSKHKFRSSTLPVLITVGPVSLWLAFFVVIPLLYVFIMSFCSIDENYNVVFQFTLDNYRNLMDVNYLQIYAQSILIAFFATVICLVLGYPFAFLISRTFQSRKTFLYMLVIIPFWTNSLIRIYGWRTFLGASGWLNQTLMALHLTDSPMDFLFNRFATILGMAYVLFPFMVLPLYTAIEKLDPSQLEVSADLGARGGATFWNVVLPQTVSGVFSGCIMVFIPSLGYFYVADILGGGNSDVIGNLIERQFQSGNNWPFGAALSIILIAVTLLLVKLYQKCGGDMQSLGV